MFWDVVGVGCSGVLRGLGGVVKEGGGRGPVTERRRKAEDARTAEWEEHRPRLRSGGGEASAVAGLVQAAAMGMCMCMWFFFFGTVVGQGRRSGLEDTGWTWELGEGVGEDWRWCGWGVGLWL